MTNRQLTTHIASLKRGFKKMAAENNPVIQLSGQRFGSVPKVPMRRSINATFNVPAAGLKITGSSLQGFIPDGARILGFTATNRTGRRVAVEIPVDSLLCYFGPNGNPAVNSRESWAPLSRFPVVNVNIPDVVSATIDTNNATAGLFTLRGTYGLTTTEDFVTLTMNYIDYV